MKELGRKKYKKPIYIYIHITSLSFGIKLNSYENLNIKILRSMRGYHKGGHMKCGLSWKIKFIKVGCNSNTLYTWAEDRL